MESSRSINTPFFYSIDPTFANDPYIQEIIKDREDERLQPIYISGFAMYPVGYRAIQFKMINKTRMFCRELKLLIPEDGFWIILDEWTRPSCKAEDHYIKQLRHMDFPQIIKFEEGLDYELMLRNEEALKKLHQDLAACQASMPPPSNP